MAARGRFLAVVCHGEMETYRLLKKELEEPEVVEVVWDRRVQERRRVPGVRVPDRRLRERRGPPSEMWRLFRFVVAPGGDSA